RRVVLRVNDRGPFVDNRIIDLSRGAADALDLRRAGVGEVRVRYLGRAPRQGGGATLQYATAPAAAPSPALPSPAAGPVPYQQVATLPQPTPYQASTVPPRAGLWIEAGTWPDAGEARRAADRLGGGATVEQAAPGRYRVLVG